MADDEAASVLESPRIRDLSFRANSPGGFGVGSAGKSESRGMMRVDGKISPIIDWITGASVAAAPSNALGLALSSIEPEEI